MNAATFTQYPAILGKPLSDTARPPLGSTRETVDVWYNGLVTSAQRDLEAAAQTTSYPATAAVLDQIAQLLVAYDTPKRALAANEGLAILSDLGDATEEIERRTNAILPIDSKVTLAPIDRTMGRLGEIIYSFAEASVVRSLDGVHGRPATLFEPYWVRQDSFENLHNTDPFVFGGFYYTDCKQGTSPSCGECPNSMWVR